MSMELIETCIARLKLIKGMSDRVAGIAELENSQSGVVPPTPYLYLLLLAETAAPNEIITLVMQKVTANFGVVLAVPNTINPTGLRNAVSSTGQLPALRASVKSSLLGWEPDGNHSPITYVGGRMVQVKGAVVWWQDEFTTDYYIRSN